MDRSLKEVDKQLEELSHHYISLVEQAQLDLSELRKIQEQKEKVCVVVFVCVCVFLWCVCVFTLCLSQCVCTYPHIFSLCAFVYYAVADLGGIHASEPPFFPE